MIKYTYQNIKDKSKFITFTEFELNKIITNDLKEIININGDDWILYGWVKNI